jgi:hypothetical protein
VWQTGATSEHRLQRRVHTYRNSVDLDRLRRRITELNVACKMDKEIAAILNKEGFCGRSWLQIQRRERLVAAKTLGYPYGQNQRCQYEPDALARWQFLDPRSGGSTRYYDSNGV